MLSALGYQSIDPNWATFGGQLVVRLVTAKQTVKRSASFRSRWGVSETALFLGSGRSDFWTGSGLNKKKTFSFGPAVLVTAAFIGPGTLMAASSAGAQFGYQLLWAVAFSVFATIVLQQMAARLGIATGNGLSESLRSSIANTALRVSALGLVLLAIFIGNSAYQTGNILGAATGLMSAFSVTQVADASLFNQNVAVLVVTALALLVIWIGRFDVLQWLLTILVVLMSLLFVVAAIRSGPDWGKVIAGFTPRIPSGSDWIVIGLVGTTVVPYNLFLHASAAAQQWADDGQPGTDESVDERRSKAMVHSRWDTVFSVLVGGLITSAILVTASAAFHGEENASKLGKVADVAKQLEPALGLWAKRMFSLGLLAAGLTSAITAPKILGVDCRDCGCLFRDQTRWQSQGNDHPGASGQWFAAADHCRWPAADDQ